jgi:mannan endo-1,4-beta-mannosidase
VSRWRVTLLALIIAALAGLGIDRFASHPARPPATSGFLGVAEPRELASYRQVDEFAAAVGRKPDIVLFYSNWGEPFRYRFAVTVHDHGGVPFVQLSPVNVSMTAIAAGRHDSYLVSYAREVRRYGYPVIVGFAPEMNGSWNSWGWHHTSPKTWKAAWRHVVTVFRKQAATNVTWVWTINLAGHGTGPISRWWPGAQYVTWVGIDGYSGTPTPSAPRSSRRSARSGS